MKIALVSPYDFAWPGGVTVHISQLAHQFTRMGHKVKVLAPYSPSKDTLGSGDFIPLGRPVPVPSGGSVARISLSVWLAPRVRDYLEKERFDVVHIHEPLAPFLPLCVLHLSRTINVGTFHAYHGSHRWYPITHPFLKQWFRRLKGRIAVSPAAYKFVSRFFPGDYRIIPNGTDVDHFSREVPPIPEFCDGRVNILFVGRLEKRKGLKYLLGAYSRLKWDFPNIRLIVVGPGNLSKDCHLVMSERGIRDVVFTGHIPYNELPRYYRTAHIFCAPATGKESFGIVLIEAMAAGKPIVASRIEGYTSVVTHGFQGLLVPPKDETALADALALLIQNPELREEMGARGKEAVEEYRWERIAQRVMDYYISLMEAPNGPPG
jgi:phosphatidylinositol alpha-mannosyltransferase